MGEFEYIQVPDIQQHVQVRDPLSGFLVLVIARQLGSEASGISHAGIEFAPSGVDCVVAM